MSERGYCQVIPMARVIRELVVLSAISYIILKVSQFFQNCSRRSFTTAFSKQDSLLTKKLTDDESYGKMKNRRRFFNHSLLKRRRRKLFDHILAVSKSSTVAICFFEVINSSRERKRFGQFKFFSLLFQC